MSDPDHAAPAVLTAADMHVVFALDGTLASLHAFPAADPGGPPGQEHRLGVSRVTFHCTDRGEVEKWWQHLATLGVPGGAGADLPGWQEKDDIVVEFHAPPAAG